MKLSILMRDNEPAYMDLLREHIERRVAFALSRFSDGLSSVVVRIEDLNGPKGGVDKRCRVQVRGPAIGEVVVEETDVEWTAAVDRTLSLAGRSVARALERARDDRGRAPILRDNLKDPR